MAIIFMKIHIRTPFMGEIHHVQQKADKAEDHFTVAIPVQLRLLTVVHSDLSFASYLGFCVYHPWLGTIVRHALNN